jgi:hypothetical protein
MRARVWLVRRQLDLCTLWRMMWDIGVAIPIPEATDLVGGQRDQGTI